MAAQNKYLCDAIKTENLNDARSALQSGADPNAEVDSVTAMHLAAGIGLEPVCLLLQHDGDPNVRAVDGTTPLHVASIWGFSDCVQILLANGGDPSVTDQEGLNALDLARAYNNDGAVEVIQHYMYLLTAEGDQTVTPQFTYRRLSCDSVNTDNRSFHNASPDFDPDPDPDDDSADDRQHHTHDLEAYWSQLDRCGTRRRSSVYLRSLQHQVNQYFRNGRKTHLVDVTSPDHPYVEERSTPLTEPIIREHVTYWSPIHIVDSTHSPNQQTDWSPSDSGDSLHLHLSMSDKGDQSTQDSFVTCDGEDLDTVLSKSLEDSIDLSDEYDDYSRHCGNTVVKNPKFSSKSNHQTKNVAEDRSCGNFTAGTSCGVRSNRNANNNNHQSRLRINYEFIHGQEKNCRNITVDNRVHKHSERSSQNEVDMGIDSETHDKPCTPGRKSGEYRKQRYCRRDILSSPSSQYLVSSTSEEVFAGDMMSPRCKQIVGDGRGIRSDNSRGSCDLPRDSPLTLRKLQKGSSVTQKGTYVRARKEPLSKDLGIPETTRHISGDFVHVQLKLSGHDKQIPEAFSTSSDRVDIRYTQCEFCGGRAVTKGPEGLVCVGCDRLSQELEDLIEASQPAVPDIISSLPSTLSSQSTIDHAQQLTEQPCNSPRKCSPAQSIDENHLRVSDVKNYAAAAVPVFRSGQNDNLETMNDITRRLDKTCLSLQSQSDQRSSLTHVTALDDMSDSILTTDESFFERRRRPIVKSVFHDSDISTLSADTVQSYPTSVSFQSDKTPVNKSKKDSDSNSSSPDVSLAFSDNTLNDYDASNVFQYNGHSRLIKSSLRSDKQTVLRALDNVDGAQSMQKENDFKRTNKKATDIGFSEARSQNASKIVVMKDEKINAQNRISDPLFKPKMPSPSSQVSDLWTEVRACCQGRKSFRDKTNILDTAFVGRDSLASTIISDASTIDYVYTDKENGIALIERHLPSICGSAGSVASRRSLENIISGNSSNSSSKRASASFDAYNSDNSQDTQLYDWREHAVIIPNPDDTASSTYSVSSELKKLDNTVIREKLRKVGDDPGPVTDSTRQTYLRRLSQIQDNPGIVLTKKLPDYPPELCQALDGNLDMSDMAELEAKMIEAFQNPDRNRRWREGTLKSSFTYILLDPSITRNLPNRANNMADLEVFRTFISAIFYIGKGKRARPYSHLYEAIKQQKNTTGKKVSDKVQLILDIWAGGLGVVSLHCYQSVIPVEAYTREACMVDAIGLDRLTNKKRGDYYGVSVTYSMKQRRKMGVYLLTKALQIFLAEGERQIAPLDLQKDAS